MNRYDLVSIYNEQAHEEVRLAGSPRYDCPKCGTGRFGERRRIPYCKHAMYDTDEIWGVHPLDLEVFVENVKKRWHACLLPRKRRALKAEYYKWTCREAASKGLSVTFF